MADRTIADSDGPKRFGFTGYTGVVLPRAHSKIPFGSSKLSPSPEVEAAHLDILVEAA